MKPEPSVGRPGNPLSARTRGAGQGLRLALVTACVVAVAYGCWPYAALLRLNAAAASAQSSELAVLVDMEAVRDELRRKLNKDADSVIDRLSDPFIHWLEDGIQARGSRALEQLVTLKWVRDRLLAHSDPAADNGFIGQVTRARFAAPTRFRLSIGPDDALPVQVSMRLEGIAWRVSAVYY